MKTTWERGPLTLGGIQSKFFLMRGGDSELQKKKAFFFFFFLHFLMILLKTVGRIWILENQTVLLLPRTPPT